MEPKFCASISVVILVNYLGGHETFKCLPGIIRGFRPDFLAH
jgi:hypothetical protein